MKELSKEQILEAYKSLASSPRYRLSELEIFTMAVRWMEERNKDEFEVYEDKIHKDIPNFRLAKSVKVNK
jgi:hypothetical protein